MSEITMLQFALVCVALLVAGWIGIFIYYKKQIKKAKIHSWNSADKIWNDIESWSNKELRELSRENAITSEHKVVYHEVISHFQTLIKTQRLKLKRDALNKNKKGLTEVTNNNEDDD